MSSLAVETFRPVRFEVERWHLGDAAELLREPLRDGDLCRVPLAKLRREFDRILLMASGKSNYLIDKTVNETLGATAYTAAGSVFHALWTTTAGTNMKAYVGNTAGEVSGGSYDRVNKTNNTTNYANTSSGAAHVNSNAITFAAATADWNSAASIPQTAVFDANTKGAGDNLLLWGDLTVARVVLNGDTASFATSGFSWTET